MASIDKAYVDYKEIVKSLQNEESKETIYEQLMAKESNVLGIIGRIANNKNINILENSIFYNKSVFEVVMLFANSWKEIINEIFIERKNLTVYWKDIFYTGDRKIYTGMMLLFFAILILCVNASAGTSN